MDDTGKLQRTYDRYIALGGGQAPRDTAEDRRDRLDELNQRVARDVGYRREDGARMLAGVVMDSGQTVSKITALIGSGNYAAAKKTYDDFRNIIQSNVNDIAAMTRDDIRRSGQLGEALAGRAAGLLAGSYNASEVTLSDGTKTTIGDVLGENASFEGFKRESLRGLGFNDTVADMYFGSHGDTARSLIQRVVDPALAAQTDKRPQVDPLQTADLANFLSQKDSDGTLVNLGKIQSLYGNSSGALLGAIMKSHAVSGDYTRTLDNFLQMGEAMKAEGEDGSALMSKVSSAYTNLFRSSFAGLRPDGSDPTARDQLIFDSALAKTMTALKRRGASIDVSNPSFVASFRELMDQISWADDLGVDLVRASNSAGASYLGQAGEWAAGFMTGQTTPGLYTSVAALRNGLSGVVGARQPTAKYGSRSDGTTPAQRTVGAASSFSALDGLAHGFQQQVAKTVLPRLATGREPAAAMVEILTDSSSSNALRAGLASQVRKFMPAASSRLHTALADKMFDMWYQSGGATMCVEDAVDSLLADQVLDPGSDRQLRVWAAANTDPAPEKARWRELLTSHFATDHPKDPGRAAQRTASAMTELEKARLRGDDPERVLDTILSQGRFFYRDVYVGTDGKPTGHPFLVDGQGRPRKYVVKERYGDLRKAAANARQSINEFYADQQYLQALQRADADTAAKYQNALIREMVKDGQSDPDAL